MIREIRGHIKVIDSVGSPITSTNAFPVTIVGIPVITISGTVPVSGSLAVSTLNYINDPKIYNALALLVIEIKKIRILLETLTDERVVDNDLVGEDSI